MRTDTYLHSSTARIGLIVLLVLVATSAFVATRRPLDALRQSEHVPSVAKDVPAPQKVALVAPAPLPATPVTPVYAARSDPSPSSPIYRCRSGKRTIYTQEPCENGRVVVTSSAVDGYDSKPSDRLERLVADGRETTASPSPPVVASTLANGSTGAQCANLAQQVAVLDADARRPNDLRTLDTIRRNRQDVRTRMARLGC